MKDLKKLTGFSALDIVLKENPDAEFSQQDQTQGKVTVGDFIITERTDLRNDWNSVLIKKKSDSMDSRVCIRYLNTELAKSPQDNLRLFVSGEVIQALQFFNLIK